VKGPCGATTINYVLFQKFMHLQSIGGNRIRQIASEGETKCDYATKRKEFGFRDINNSSRTALAGRETLTLVFQNVEQNRF